MATTVSARPIDANSLGALNARVAPALPSVANKKTPAIAPSVASKYCP